MLQRFQVLQQDADGRARVPLQDGSVKEFPVGGPYTIDGVEDIMVGDLYVLSGQSNMAGRGDLRNPITSSSHSHIRLFRSSETWSVACEPLHTLYESPYSIHKTLGGIDLDPTRWKGVGCGLFFATHLYEYNKVPIGLIPTAHGATSMAQWTDGMEESTKDTLYNAMISGIQKAGGKVKGVLWYQGENDARNDEEAALYTERMISFVEHVRKDLNNPELPFYCSQIGRIIVPKEVNPSSWNKVREEQRKLTERVPNLRITSSIDLELVDWIHLDTLSQRILGQRFANLVIMPSISLSSVTLTTDPRYPTSSIIRISFDNVPGTILKSTGRPCGFSLRTVDEKDLSILYRVELKGTDVLLWVDEGTVQAETKIPTQSKNEWWKMVFIWYGYGFDPICNVMDNERGAMPAFGPLSIES